MDFIHGWSLACLHEEKVRDRCATSSCSVDDSPAIFCRHGCRNSVNPHYIERHGSGGLYCRSVFPLAGLTGPTAAWIVAGQTCNPQQSCSPCVWPPMLCTAALFVPILWCMPSVVTLRQVSCSVIEHCPPYCWTCWTHKLSDRCRDKSRIPPNSAEMRVEASYTLITLPPV